MKPFYEAEKIKFDNKNYELWLQGRYTWEAVGIAISNNFGNKKGYLEKPYDFSGKEEEEKEYTEEEKLELQEKFLMQLQISMLNYEHRKK